MNKVLDYSIATFVTCCTAYVCGKIVGKGCRVITDTTKKVINKKEEK